MKKNLLLFFLLLTAGIVSAGEQLLLQLSGERDGVIFRKYSVSPELQLKPRPDRKRPRFLRISGELQTDSWKTYEIRFTPGQFGAVELRLSSIPNKETPHWILFDGLQMQGATLLNPDFEQLSGSTFAYWKSRPENLCRDAASGKSAASVLPAAPVRQMFTVAPGRQVVLRFRAKVGGAAPARLDNSTRFPWIDPIKTIPHPVIPPVQVCNRNVPKKENFQLKIQLAGNSIKRLWPIRFGMPFPKGEISAVQSLHVTDWSGKELPSQIVPLLCWPDGSVKTALVQFQGQLASKPQTSFFITGKKPKTPAVYPKLSLRAEADRFVVSTGDLRVSVNKFRFQFLSGVWYKNQYLGRFADQGFEIRDEERGIINTKDSEKTLVCVEEYGPMTITLRADGWVGSMEQPQFRYTARLRFFAGSPLVEMRWTLYAAQNWLRKCSSCSLSFFPAALPQKLQMENIAGESFFQPDDRKMFCDGKATDKKLSGAGRLTFGKHALTFALCNAWKRYPKGFRLTGKSLSFDLLPQLPEDFGSTLPAAMRFPFEEGLYKLCCGNGITETLCIDFSGKKAPEVLAAADPLAVWPQSYLAKTSLFPDGISRQKHFDKSAVSAVKKLLAQNREKRAYGFWNFGDFLTDDSKIWNNNSFDFTHGLYQLFLRTGDVETGLAARANAVHTAAVDTRHYAKEPACTGLQSSAFPPFPVGKIFPHFPEAAEYNSRSFTAGLTDAWLLEGNAEAMDAALLTGENLLRFAVPSFIPDRDETRGACLLESLLALYRATHDPRYLQAAGTVVEKITDTQKKEFGGAWPHTLPQVDRNAAGKDFVFGADTRTAAILLSALREYRKLSGKKNTQSAEEAAARWLLRGFLPAEGCWPDTMSWDNFPCRRSIGRSTVQAAAAAALPEGKETIKHNWDYLSALGMPESAPELAELLFYAPRLLEFLPEKRGGSPVAALLKLRKIANGFRVSSASRLRYTIVLAESRAKLRLVFQAIPGSARDRRQYTVSLKNSSGKSIWKRQLPHHRTQFLDIPLSGKKGEKFSLEITGGHPGFWQLEPGNGFSAVLHWQKDLCFAPGGQKIPLNQLPDTAGEVQLSSRPGCASAGLCLPGNAPKIPAKLIDSRLRERFSPEKNLTLTSGVQNVCTRELLVISSTPFSLKLSGFSSEIPIL